MNGLVAAGLAAIALSCVPIESTPQIPVQQGAEGRLCYQCLNAKSETLRCEPDLEDACAIYLSDVRGPVRIHLTDD